MGNIEALAAGNEINISLQNINKGSGIGKLMVAWGLKNDEAMVAGDAGNDAGLFAIGVAASVVDFAGEAFYPGIRVAMPWTDDQTIWDAANVHNTMPAVLLEWCKSLAGIEDEANLFARLEIDSTLQTELVDSAMLPLMKQAYLVDKKKNKASMEKIAEVMRNSGALDAQVVMT